MRNTAEIWRMRTIIIRNMKDGADVDDDDDNVIIIMMMIVMIVSNQHCEIMVVADL